MKLSAAVVCVKGPIRGINQDNYCLNHTVRSLQEQDSAFHWTSECAAQVFSVCDGMGGEEAGEEASLRTVELLSQCAEEDAVNDWQQLIADANASVCNLCAERGIRAGTTLAMLTLEGGTARAINVGDSRIYLIRDGQIRQLSYDHTEFQTMVDAGVFTSADFAHSSTHNHLTQHLGIRPDVLVLDPYVQSVDKVQTGDVFLLCSDGLYGTVSDEVMLALIQQGDALEETCRKLVNKAIEDGSRDNTTAMLVEVQADGGGSAASEPLTTKTVDATQCNPDTAVQDRRVSGKKSPILPVLLCAVVLAVGIAGYWLWSNPQVANVVSQTQAQAQEKLTGQGFQVAITEQNSDTVDAGAVMEQSAAAGVRLHRGAAITLTVSAGPESVEVPDTVGMMKDQAKELLEQKGFEVNEKSVRSDDAETGVVLTQDPQSGTLLCGSTISLTVCSGPETVEVPDVVGKSVAEADDSLEEAGFDIKLSPQDAQSDDVIIKQKPKAGKKEKYGKKVRLTALDKDRIAVMPDILGMPYQEAYKVLDELELGPEYNWKEDSSAYGTVIEQQYPSGTILEKGSAVFFWISQSNSSANGTSESIEAPDDAAPFAEKAAVQPE